MGDDPINALIILGLGIVLIILAAAFIQVLKEGPDGIRRARLKGLTLKTMFTEPVSKWENDLPEE